MALSKSMTVNSLKTNDYGLFLHFRLHRFLHRPSSRPCEVVGVVNLCRQCIVLARGQGFERRQRNIGEEEGNNQPKMTKFAASLKNGFAFIEAVMSS